MKKVLLIDNYDSFTYNLVHAIEEILGQKVDVYKNDHITSEETERYEYLILSPGPGLPDEAGNLKDIIRHSIGKKKIFGVCLGLQAIAEVYGCQLKNLDQVYHGIQSEITITDPESKIYSGLPQHLKAGRYHSWVIDSSTLTDNLKITSIETHDQIMSVEDTAKHVYAVQYHPESIMTPEGNKILSNFLSIE